MSEVSDRRPVPVDEMVPAALLVARVADLEDAIRRAITDCEPCGGTGRESGEMPISGGTWRWNGPCRRCTDLRLTLDGDLPDAPDEFLRTEREEEKGND